MDLALGLMAFNLYKTARQGEKISYQDREPLAPARPPVVATPNNNWLENPSTIVIVAGIGFFVVAVFLLGAVPWLQASTHSTSVTDVVTGLPISCKTLFARGRTRPAGVPSGRVLAMPLPIHPSGHGGDRPVGSSLSNRRIRL